MATDQFLSPVDYKNLTHIKTKQQAHSFAGPLLHWKCSPHIIRRFIPDGFI